MGPVDRDLAAAYPDKLAEEADLARPFSPPHADLIDWQSAEFGPTPMGPPGSPSAPRPLTPLDPANWFQVPLTPPQPLEMRTSPRSDLERALEGSINDMNEYVTSYIEISPI
jgi:hypothetical protein